MGDSPKRVLIVGGDSQILQPLHDKLAEAGYEVTRVEDGSSARLHIEQNGLPHLVVVDLRLPDMEGLRLCENLYELADLPIVTISAQDSPEEAIRALQCADDYIRKPFATDELVLRIWRILSRIDDFSYASGPTLQLCDWLTLDPNRREITIDGVIKRLTPIEHALLHVLLKHRGKVVDADTLIQRVWRSEPTEGDRNALRVHMHRLRNKLQRAPGAAPAIITERGVGYAFVAV